MSSKENDPFWTVRGVLNGEDVFLVVEAPSQVSAELFATKRGVDVVLVSTASTQEQSQARLSGRIWRYTPQARLRCFGRSVSHMQAGSLVLCGLATIVLDLRAHHVPLSLHWW